MREEMRQIRFSVFGKADRTELIEKIIQLEDEIYKLQEQTIDDYLYRMIKEAVIDATKE